MNVSRISHVSLNAIFVIIALTMVFSQVSWGVNRVAADTLNPHIKANPSLNFIEGRDWPNGTPLTLTIDDPINGVGVDLTVYATVGPVSGNPDDIKAYFELNGFDLQQGQILKVTDGATSPTERTYTVSNIAVTDYDLAADTVSGIATPDAQVHVCADVPGGCSWLTVTAAAGTGAWTADFAGLVDLQPGSNGGAYEQDGNGNQTFVDWHIVNPNIKANPSLNFVEGRDWPNGTALTLTIDDPTNGVGVDLTVYATVGPVSGNPDDIKAYFDLNGFDLQQGQILKVTDGAMPPTERTYTVSHIAVTGYDLAADTVSGIATPGVQVHVCADVPGGCSWLTVTAAAGTGAWTADFAGLVDLQPGSNGGAYEQDGNGNQTYVDWHIPNPSIKANPSLNFVEGRDWPNGTPLTLTIDDPTNGIGVDLTVYATVGPVSGNPDDIKAYFDLNGFDLQQGQILKVTDGATPPTERTYTVSNLAITGFDLATDTVSGIATPDVQVQVVTCANTGWNCVSRYVTSAAGTGNWSVDYGGLVDLQSGSVAMAREMDANGNETYVDWHIPNPSIKANPSLNFVEGRDWPNGTALTLTIDDPTNGVGVDLTVLASMGPSFGNPDVIVAYFDLNGFDLQQGQILKVTDGATPPNERTYMVSNLAIIGFDLVADTVSGIATPGVQIQVVTCANVGWNCVSRYVTSAAGTGNWSVDYGGLVDLQPGSVATAREMDTNGNETFVDWHIPNPSIKANPSLNFIEGRDWPNGTPLTLTIDDPINGIGVDLTVYATVGPVSGNPDDIKAYFDLNGFDLQQGQFLKVTDGATPPTERTYTVSNLAVTGFDLATDMISGIATPDVQVEVVACVKVLENCVSRYVTPAAGTGIWSADYSGFVDLQPGSVGTAKEMDANSNETFVDWHVLNPSIKANPGLNMVKGRDWPNGTLLTLTIDDPTNGVGADLTVYATIGPVSGNPDDIVADFNLKGFDLLQGQILKITDEATPPTERTYKVSNLSITGFDLAADTISGIATPGIQVEVVACDHMVGSCATFYPTPTPGTGAWGANYAGLVDLQPGSIGTAREIDTNGNETFVDWRIYNPAISQVLPQQGLGSIPNDVYIYGDDFAEGAIARLGTTDLTTLRFSSNQLCATVPQGLTAGIYTLTVTNPDGTKATLANTYAVLPDTVDDLYAYAYEFWSAPSTLFALQAGQVGLVVHRQGGTSPVSNLVVRFYLGNPAAGGMLLGDSSIPLLSPRGALATSGVSWTPAVAEEYTIYAVIDPDNHINETLETNNVVSRTITVLPAVGDQLAPQVDSFAVNDGVNPISNLVISLDTVASDNSGGSGVASLLFVQYQYSAAADLWTPVQNSGWLDYATARVNYEWELMPASGVIYLQAWAMDRAGNISIFPYGAYVDYLPPSETVAVGQAHIYRYHLSAGQSITVTVTPHSGDPDLYIWAPDYATRSPWVSNLSSGVEEISFNAPVEGIYQVEVYGYTAAEYSISVKLSAATQDQTTMVDRIAVDKSIYTQPYVALDSRPGDFYAPPPIDGHIGFRVYLPLVIR